MAQSLLLPRRELLTGAAVLPLFNIIKSRPAEAQSPCGAFTPTISSIASNAGFTKLVFRDDFTTKGVVEPSPGTATTGYNWFLRTGIGITINNAVVNPTGTCSGVGNGNNGTNGPFPSPLGGILTLSCPTAGGNGNTTVTSTPAASIKSYNPGFGCWGHFCMEIYSQQNVTVSANNQWYAEWFQTQLCTASGAHCTEIDLEENYSFNFSSVQGEVTTGGHQFPGGGGGSVGDGGGDLCACSDGSSRYILDSNWHLWTMVWQSTGTGTGYIEIFIDGVQMYNYNGGSPINRIPTGTGGILGYQWLEDAGELLYLQLGTPNTASMNIDYINVYQ